MTSNPLGRVANVRARVRSMSAGNGTRQQLVTFLTGAVDDELQLLQNMLTVEAAADDPAVQASLQAELAAMLVATERNYYRETSAPGSRFEGRTLEAVQAEAVLRRVREHSLQLPPGGA
jgi:hypothetical protein